MTRLLTYIVLLVVVAVSGGCSQGARSLKLDKDVAHQSFETFLSAWRDGKTPKDLQEGKPQIICGDHQWRNGQKLVSFEILPTEESDGTNLKLTAKLTIELANKKTEVRTVEYIVGTSPVITIFPP